MHPLDGPVNRYITPLMPGSSTKTALFCLRLPHDVRQAVQDEAARAGESLSASIVRLIRRALVEAAS